MHISFIWGEFLNNRIYYINRIIQKTHFSDILLLEVEELDDSLKLDASLIYDVGNSGVWDRHEEITNININLKYY